MCSSMRTTLCAFVSHHQTFSILGTLGHFKCTNVNNTCTLDTSWVCACFVYMGCTVLGNLVHSDIFCCDRHQKPLQNINMPCTLFHTFQLVLHQPVIMKKVVQKFTFLDRNPCALFACLFDPNVIYDSLHKTAPGLVFS